MVGLFAVDSDNSSGDADHGGIFGDFSQNNGIGGDSSIIADFDGSQNLGAGTDHHIVAQSGMTLALHDAGAAQGHALVDQAVIADLRGRADDDAGAVVNDQTAADGGGGMNFDTRQPLGDLAQKPGQKLTSMTPQPMADAVTDDGMQAVVKQENFQLRPCRRVVFLISL